MNDRPDELAAFEGSRTLPVGSAPEADIAGDAGRLPAFSGKPANSRCHD